MIQDIAPHQFHVDYSTAPAVSDDILLPITQGNLWVKADNRFFTCGELMLTFHGPENFRFLFSIDKKRYYMLRSEQEVYREAGSSNLASFLPAGAKSLSPKELRALKDIPQVFIAYTAWHLNEWYRTNRYCSVCGSLLVDGIDERKLVCPSCGHLVYPRINPCVIVAIYDHDRLLMTRYAGRDVTWLVLVAGFTEIGETAEDTVRREVLEETGVHVKNIRYFGSQPWGIPGNLTLGFTAELSGSDALSVERDELSEALWVPRSEVPDRTETDKLSITAAMINAFRRGEF